MFESPAQKPALFRRLAALALLTPLLLNACHSDDAGTNTNAAATEDVAPTLPELTSWSYGVISDTQWTTINLGKNPNSVATSIIAQVDQKFIEHGVDLVVAVGDVTDDGSVEALDTRAIFAQTLYNAGIAFYPLRGNHENNAEAASEFVRIFPQTQDGINNVTPDDVLEFASSDLSVRVALSWLDATAENTGDSFTLGENFSSPSDALAGLSYSFEYKNATFMMLDQFTLADGSSHSVADQLAWIDTTLSSRVDGTHGFVLVHKTLIGGNHDDNLFGSYPGESSTAEDTFITSLSDNDVHYLIGGHDHMHDLSKVATTDGESAYISQLISASDSSKFYTPVAPSNDETYSNPLRQTPIAQELYSIGYYVYTIEGNNVTVDFYSDVINDTGDSIVVTPELDFTKKQTFGYGLDGQEFFVAQGESYSKVSDSYTANGLSTTAGILGGTNEDTDQDYAGRAFSRLVSTGWIAQVEGLASHIFVLWGMPEALNGDDEDTEPFPIALSYNTSNVTAEALESGRFCLAYLDRDNQEWVNAAERSAETTSFVNGPWDAAYPLGTYGVDPDSKTVWAVIDYNGSFAAVTLSE